MCGAEKLPAGVAQEFQQKFGILPMEGYGCTELSPAALSTCPTGRWTVSGRLATSPAPSASRFPASPPASSIGDLSRPAAGAGGIVAHLWPHVMVGYLGKLELTKEVIATAGT